MKTNTSLLAAIFFLIGSFTLLNAQNDGILKANGNEMNGKVVEMDSAQPSAKSMTESNNQLSEHHNKVAILPFAYVKDRVDGSSTMSNKIQAKTYSIYNKRKVNFEFQDPKTTNALLVKSGVKNIAGYAMDEICKILNVEYVVYGTVSVEQAGQSSYTTSAKRERFEIESPKKGGLRTDSKETGLASTKSKTNYDTSITMNIYNDKGENIFNQDHYSFESDDDSYKIMLKYLAKRTPIYSK